MEDFYKLITFPEVQDLMEKEGFEDNAEPSVNTNGAYFVSVEWLNNLKADNTPKCEFIDRLEIEEMLCEYYDFSNVSEKDWQEINKAVESECQRQGISSTDDYEAYAKICDGCVSRILKK